MLCSRGYYQKAYKLSSISWEKSRTWGLGFDATVNNKINVTFDYYDRRTTGIIMDVPVPAEFGLDAYKDNVGEMSNRGVEVILSYNNKWGIGRLVQPETSRTTKTNYWI